MARIAKTPAELRREAARLCRELARECVLRGGDEQADALREAAESIARLRLSRDVPKTLIAERDASSERKAAYTKGVDAEQARTLMFQGRSTTTQVMPKAPSHNLPRETPEIEQIRDDPEWQQLAGKIIGYAKLGMLDAVRAAADTLKAFEAAESEGLKEVMKRQPALFPEHDETPEGGNPPEFDSARYSK